MGLFGEYVFRDLLVGGCGSLGQFGGQNDLVEVFTVKISLREVLM